MLPGTGVSISDVDEGPEQSKASLVEADACQVRLFAGFEIRVPWT